MASSRRAPIPATDADGAPIFILHTACGTPFKVDAEDLPLIGNGPFFFNDAGCGAKYVRTWGLDNLTMVSRLVTLASRGKIVRYLDRDRTNLRSKNLRLDGGYAKRTDADLLPRDRDEPEAA